MASLDGFAELLLLPQASAPNPGTGVKPPKPAPASGAAATATTGTASSPAATPADEAQFVTSFRIVQASSTDAQAIVDAIEAFNTQVQKINVPLTLDTVPYNARQTQPGTLTIKTVDVNKDAANPKVKTGDFGWSFNPRGPVELHVDAAMVYSFIEARRFGTQAADGQFKVVRTDSGNAVNGTNIGAMLTIVPRTWNDPTFGGGFQIGVTPEKDKIGFYTGAVVRLYDLISIGGGIAYQQMQRLAAGISEGQLLSSADQLKTTTAFKAGPYVTITVKIK